MARHRIHRTRSIAFKRRFVLEYLAGETLHGPAGRHDLSRTPIRIRVEKYETGAFDEDAGRPRLPFSFAIRRTAGFKPPRRKSGWFASR